MLTLLPVFLGSLSDISSHDPSQEPIGRSAGGSSCASPLSNAHNHSCPITTHSRALRSRKSAGRDNIADSCLPTRGNRT